MKALKLFPLLIFCMFFFSCKEEGDKESEVFRVEVLGKGMDCGNLFLIRFEEDDESRVTKYLEYTNAYYPVFYAVGLSDEFKEPGVFLNITVGRCSSNEFVACTALGPGYGLVCIKSAAIISTQQ